jgi:hypothetical protein
MIASRGTCNLALDQGHGKGMRQEGRATMSGEATQSSFLTFVNISAVLPVCVCLALAPVGFTECTTKLLFSRHLPQVQQQESWRQDSWPRRPSQTTESGTRCAEHEPRGQGSIADCENSRHQQINKGHKYVVTPT